MRVTRVTLPVLRWIVFSCILISAVASHAAITVLRHYRLGDADPGAAIGLVATNSVDSIGTNPLTIGGSPVYSGDVGYFSSVRSLQFSGTNFATATVISNLTDNFGVEAWVKTTANAGSHVVVYNGDTGGNGWGIVQNDGSNVWSVLFGGRTSFGSVPVTVDQWTHLALVRSNGLATLYVNGVARAIDTNAPFAASGALAVGAVPQDTSIDTWQGWIDEVRVFTFVAGAAEPSVGSFSTADLLAPYVPADPLRLGIVQQANQIGLFWPTNRSVVAETATNLPSTNWTALSNPVATNGQFTLTNKTGAPSGFYRLRRVPCAIETLDVPVVTVNPGLDGEETFFAGAHPGQPGLANNFNQGGYKMSQFVDGSIVNYFDASAAIANLACDPADPPPSFKWNIYASPASGGFHITTYGITGYCGPFLRIAENSLPALTTSDDFWRVSLTITYQHAGQPSVSLVNWFHFEYLQTMASLLMYQNCQQCPGDSSCPTCSGESQNIRAGVDCSP